MKRKEATIKKAMKAVVVTRRLPKNERERVTRAFMQLRKERHLLEEWEALGALSDVILTWDYSKRKKAADRRSDGKTRRTLGARVPVDFYEACKRSAEMQRVSVYRWVMNAFKAALEEK